MQDFASSSEAFRKARARASVAASVEASTLHMAIHDAREAGMSVREAAAALGVPKSTVSRHWRVDHRCAEAVPVWGSVSEWREAHAAAWAHDPQELADRYVPYAWGVEAEQLAAARTPRLKHQAYNGSLPTNFGGTNGPQHGDGTEL